MYHVESNNFIIEPECEHGSTDMSFSSVPSTIPEINRCSVCNGSMIPVGKSNCMVCSSCGHAEGHCDI